MKKVVITVILFLLVILVSCTNDSESSDELTSEKTAVSYLLGQNGTCFYDYSTFAENKNNWTEPEKYSFKLVKTQSSLGNRNEYMSVTVSGETADSDYSNCYGYKEGTSYTYEPFYSTNSISDWLNYIEDYYRESVEETNKTRATKNTIKITWDEIDGLKYPKTVIFTSENFEPLAKQILTRNPLFAGTDEKTCVCYEISDFSITE